MVRIPAPQPLTVQLEKVFLGSTPQDQRRFIAAALAHLRERGYERVVVPCCGTLSLASAAIEAGFRPEQIEASDISLFSSVLGYLCAGRPLEQLRFTLGEPWAAEYAECADELERAAFLVWLMKLCQLRTDLVYERELWLEYRENAGHYRARLRAKLEELRGRYGGLDYRIRDLREVLLEERAAAAAVIVNPPAFRRGYEKMFDFGEAIRFDAGVAEFDLAAEYDGLYARTHRKPELFFWYRRQEADDYPAEELVFGRQYSARHVDYWLCTKPAELDGLPYRYHVVKRRPASYAPFRAPIFGECDEIRPDSTVRFVEVDEGTALYYRDLWAHKLGSTRAEHYYLALIDGKVFATVGLMTEKLLRLKVDRVFENFGFNVPLARYPRANRLLMLCLTCREFGDVVRATASRINRLYELRGLRTTCLSKYRKVKLNNGILDLEHREKLANGMYRLVYDAEFRPEGFGDCVRRFLAEEAAR